MIHFSWIIEKNLSKKEISVSDTYFLDDLYVCSYAVVIQKSFPLLLDCWQFFKNFSIFRDRNIKVYNEYDWAGDGYVLDVQNHKTYLVNKKFHQILSTSEDFFDNSSPNSPRFAKNYKKIEKNILQKKSSE